MKNFPLQQQNPALHYCCLGLRSLAVDLLEPILLAPLQPQELAVVLLQTGPVSDADDGEVWSVEKGVPTSRCFGLLVEEVGISPLLRGRVYQCVGARFCTTLRPPCVKRRARKPLELPMQFSEEKPPPRSILIAKSQRRRPLCVDAPSLGHEEALIEPRYDS